MTVDFFLVSIESAIRGVPIVRHFHIAAFCLERSMDMLTGEGCGMGLRPLASFHKVGNDTAWQAERKRLDAFFMRRM